MSTYLTEALEGRTDADWAAAAERAAEQQRTAELFDDIGRETAMAYATGEIKAEAMIQTLNLAAKKFRLGKMREAQIVGYWILEAKRSPAERIANRRTKGAPAWHRRLAVQGVPYAVEHHGAVVSRESTKPERPSAFRWVADHLTRWGLPTTPVQVEKWYLASKA